MRIFIALCLYWFVVIGVLAEPCVLPFHHMIHYAHDPAKPDDIMATYLRVDSTRQVAPTYYEYGGYMRNMTVRGTFAFISRNWASKDGPDGVKTDYHWFATFAKNYRGGLPSVPLKQPAEPNIVEPTPYRISATTKEGGVYHLPTCRYVSDTAKEITIKQAAMYRPCSVCRPDDPIELLKSILPAEIVGDVWMNKDDD